MLTGARVTLRAIVPDDLDALFALESDPATWELRQPTAPVPLDRRVWAERLHARLAEERDTVRFAIEAEGAFVGRCSVVGVDHLARHASVSIALGAGARGRGYGSDALRVLVRFAFMRHNLHRLQVEVLATNAAAIACYRTVGFVEEGRRRQHAWVDGRYEDDLIMGLLRDEWAAGGHP